MFIQSAARIVLTFAAASLMTVVAMLPVAAHAEAAAMHAATAANGAQQPARPETKFCLRQEPTTGSILAIHACKTRAEWAAEGVTIDAKNVVHQD